MLIWKNVIQVELIYVNDDFFGISSSYSDDIAIILLSSYVKTNDIVLPICMDWSKQYTIPNKSTGKVWYFVYYNQTFTLLC